MAAVTTAAVVGAAGAAYAASEQSSAAKSANSANARNMADTNAMNYRLFQEGRGSTGYAQLPFYANQGGNPFEKQLFNDAVATYDASAGISGPQAIENYRAAIFPLQAAQSAANEQVGNLFNGQRVNQQISNIQPILNARTNVAQSKRQASLEALNASLNNIKAGQARKGFAGDSLGSRMMDFNARRSIATQSASDTGAVNLQNATDVANMRNADLDTRLQNLHMPYAMSQQNINLQSLPERMAADNSAARQSMFNWFRIGPQSFQHQNMPQVQPVANNGQIFGQTIAGLANTAGTAYQNKQNMDLLKQLMAQQGTNN